jgi:hypothetical protein
MLALAVSQFSLISKLAQYSYEKHNRMEAGKTVTWFTQLWRRAVANRIYAGLRSQKTPPGICLAAFRTELHPAQRQLNLVYGLMCASGCMFC